MTRRTTLPLRTLLLAAGLALASPPGAQDRPRLPQVTLQRDDAQWRADYRFDRPVEEFRFARPDRQGHRAALWAPLDDALVIAREDGEEVVRRRDGAAFRRASFRMAPRYVTLEKDYAPFSPFGDGGLLIHTGRFFACAPRCDEGAAPTWRFTVHAPAGAEVLQGGKRHARIARFVERDSGTNLYVGGAEPIETSHVLAVVDATFPADTRAMLEATFPRLMDFYAERLGALRHKPMLFASHDAAHPGGGYGHQGGTLPGQVFVHLYGKPPGDDARVGPEAMRGFFAHEAGHLYQRYGGGADEDAWLHEGGAEAFSLLALEQLGLAGAPYRRATIETALERCAAGNGGRVLRAAAAEGRFDDYYRCGLLIHLVVDGATRRRSAGRCDLFCVWRDFLARVEQGAAWGAETWFAAVDAHAGQDTGAMLREAVGAVQADPRASYARALEQAGVSWRGPEPIE
jgi:hypothetical protein